MSIELSPDDKKALHDLRDRSLAVGPLDLMVAIDDIDGIAQHVMYLNGHVVSFSLDRAPLGGTIVRHASIFTPFPAVDLDIDFWAPILAELGMQSDQPLKVISSGAELQLNRQQVLTAIIAWKAAPNSIHYFQIDPDQREAKPAEAPADFVVNDEIKAKLLALRQEVDALPPLSEEEFERIKAQGGADSKNARRRFGALTQAE